MSEAKGCPRVPLIHIPHDGELFHPNHFFSVRSEVVQQYHLQMADLHVTKLKPPEYVYAQFPYSRMICDVERRTGPDEPMEKYGMGFYYTKVYDGTVIRDDRRILFNQVSEIYRDHHSRMNNFCRNHPRVLLIDLHSYHDRIVLPEFRLPGKELPDLCIGTDPRFTPPELAECVRRKFQAAGFATEMNYPYSGFYVPESVEDGSSGCDLIGIMLEFHRRTYLDGESVNPEKTEKIRGIIREIVEEWKQDKTYQNGGISMKHEKSVGAVVYKVENGERLFLIEHMVKGHISIPKGHVERNETEEETALREIREETGLEVQLDTAFRHVVSWSPYEGVEKEVVFFTAQPTGGVLKNQEEEVSLLEWLPYEKAVEAVTYDSVREVLVHAEEYFRAK